WHHILKGHFLKGKHNWHLYCLLYLLSDPIEQYYQVKHDCCQAGFEGEDLENKEQRCINEAA
ncbi:hypothetical protein BS47DRAFT_1254808, partial [Hydnum rufescens UP504]